MKGVIQGLIGSDALSLKAQQEVYKVLGPALRVCDFGEPAMPRARQDSYTGHGP